LSGLTPDVRPDPLQNSFTNFIFINTTVWYVYAKNVKEDLSEEEKKILRKLVKKLKDEASHG